MNNMIYHSRFRTQIDAWTPIRALYKSIFSDAEIETLTSAANCYQDKNRQIVILAFENRYAALGGLSSVTRYLPRYLSEIGERVVFITPFHKNNAAIRAACAAGLIKKTFSDSDCGFGSFKGSVTCYEEPDAQIPTYYIDIKDFFKAGFDPYCYDDKTKLLEDSLAFCSVLPFILNRLLIKEHVLIHANDWETAPAALSVKIAVLKSILTSAKVVFTLHNSYDAEIPEGKLEFFFGREIPGRSVLQISLPLLDAPLTTVSEPFAYELMHDPLQKEIFAKHLQGCFSKNPPIGISNGLFDVAGVLFSKKDISDAKKGDINSLLKRKEQYHQNLRHLLKTVDDKRIIGELRFNTSEESAPVFLISGRLDMLQKGYDVIFHAFKKMKRGKAKLIFSPSNLPLNNGREYRFFVNSINEAEGDITIWPFIIPEDLYLQFLCGASYIIMPSFYEPFGAATEGFVNGTPIIARGTGGLWTQVQSIYPCRVPSFFHSFLNEKELVSLNHQSGILFREDYEGADIDKEWKLIFSASPEQRLFSKLYCSMIDTAHKALEYAVALYDKKEEYAKLIVNGFRTLSLFDWENTVKRYREIYGCMSRGTT